MLTSRAIEELILSGILTDGRRALRAIPDAATGDFRGHLNREIFRAILSLDEDDCAVSLETVYTALGPEAKYAAAAFGKGPVVSELPGILRELRGVTSLERAVSAAREIAELGNGGGGILSERITTAQRLASEILACTERGSGDVLVSLREIAEKEIALLDRIEAGEEPVKTVSVGIRGLDDVLYIEPGQLVVIGGETASGKSALCGQLTVHNAKKGRAVAFVTSEMHHRQMLVRIAAAASGSWVSTLTNPKAAADLRAQATYQSIANYPIFFQRSFPPRIEEASAAIRTAVGKHGATLAVIDYAQRLADHDEDSQEHAVARIAHEAKNLALELGIVVIAAAQVNRQVSARTDPRPKLSDLRGSGRLEQDADCVLFTYQPSRHGKTGSPEIIVAKQRNGKAGVSIPVDFHPETCTFHDLEE